MLTHVVEENICWRVWLILDVFDLSEYLLCQLPVPIHELLEPLIKHIVEDFRKALSHLDQILIRLKKHGYIYFTQHDRLLKSVSLDTRLDASSSLLVF